MLTRAAYCLPNTLRYDVAIPNHSSIAYAA